MRTAHRPPPRPPRAGSLRFEGRIAATAHHDHDAELLEPAGVDLVLRPFSDAAHDAAAALVP